MQGSELGTTFQEKFQICSQNFSALSKTSWNGLSTEPVGQTLIPGNKKKKIESSYKLFFFNSFAKYLTADYHHDCLIKTIYFSITNKIKKQTLLVQRLLALEM